jgi:serine/threonine protein kinase
VDVWALGCTLYAMMCGASPFQHALDQGASLALAVLK